MQGWRKSPSRPCTHVHTRPSPYPHLWARVQLRPAGAPSASSGSAVHSPPPPPVTQRLGAGLQCNALPTPNQAREGMTEETSLEVTSTLGLVLSLVSPSPNAHVTHSPEPGWSPLLTLTLPLALEELSYCCYTPHSGQTQTQSGDSGAKSPKGQS